MSTQPIKTVHASAADLGRQLATLHARRESALARLAAGDHGAQAVLTTVRREIAEAEACLADLSEASQIAARAAAADEAARERAAHRVAIAAFRRAIAARAAAVASVSEAVERFIAAYGRARAATREVFAAARAVRPDLQASVGARLSGDHVLDEPIAARLGVGGCYGVMEAWGPHLNGDQPLIQRDAWRQGRLVEVLAQLEAEDADPGPAGAPAAPDPLTLPAPLDPRLPADHLERQAALLALDDAAQAGTAAQEV